MVNHKINQLRESDISELLDKSPAVEELLRIAAKCSPQGRTELLSILHRKILYQGAAGQGADAPARPARATNHHLKTKPY